MRIGIDAKFLTHPQRGGFKSYTENLIGALAELDKVNEYVLYIDRQPTPEAKIPQFSNFSYKIVSGDNSFYGMPWREQVALPLQIHLDRLDLFHAPCLTAPVLMDAPLVVTIHDTMWLYPTRYLPEKTRFGKRKLMEWYYRFVPEIAVRKARGVITVSHAAKENIVSYLHLHSDQIFVTPEAANEGYHPVEDQNLTQTVLQKYGLGENYILGIGSTDPRKNIKSLIKAYALLPDSIQNMYRMVIVWNHKLLASEVLLEAETLGILKKILFVENVSDQDLLILYNRATVFVFPSLEEGFGLPPLEAMACGTPVLAADNSSIPEIVGDAALKFQAEDTGQLAELITKVITNPNLQARMKKSGLERANGFSWRNCGEATLGVYQKLASN
jgi:glycosyltransferase involved in cell wall biosynthesis